MEKKSVTIKVESPYYKVGTIDSRTKVIWIIFHGYGQLADEFASSFSKLKNDNNVLIFPQGLSKFYLQGVSKKVGATWMTAHDRDNEIDNYLTYLNQIYAIEIKPDQEKIELNILGFSQGGHTASRWIYKSNIAYSKLFLWGSSLAHEIGENEIINSFSSGKNLMVLGDKDRFIGEEEYSKLQLRYEKIGFDYQLIPYHGGHEVVSEMVQELA